MEIYKKTEIYHYRFNNRIVEIVFENGGFKNCILNYYECYLKKDLEILKTIGVEVEKEISRLEDEYEKKNKNKDELAEAIDRL